MPSRASTRVRSLGLDLEDKCLSISCSSSSQLTSQLELLSQLLELSDSHAPPNLLVPCIDSEASRPCSWQTRPHSSLLQFFSCSSRFVFLINFSIPSTSSHFLPLFLRPAANVLCCVCCVRSTRSVSLLPLSIPPLLGLHCQSSVLFGTSSHGHLDSSCFFKKRLCSSF